jgi:hypothetical protein
MKASKKQGDFALSKTRQSLQHLLPIMVAIPRRNIKVTRAPLPASFFIIA